MKQSKDTAAGGGRTIFRATHAPSSYDKNIISSSSVNIPEKTVNNTAALYSLIIITYWEVFTVRADSLDCGGDIPGYKINICANTAEELPVYLL